MPLRTQRLSSSSPSAAATAGKLKLKLKLPLHFLSSSSPLLCLCVFSFFLLVALTVLSRSLLLADGVGWSMAGARPGLGEAETEAKVKGGHIVYSSVGGFFAQDDEGTDSGSFDYATANFGLINRSYETDGEYDPNHEKTQWQRFEYQISRLNQESGHNVQYKLLYLGRHGEGYHNVAEAFYGTPAWDSYWSKKDGNGTISWSDADITPKGAAQAVIANQFWAMEIAQQKIPTPESYYTSPLLRCLKTAKITFTGLDLPNSHPFIPEVKELFRETIGEHTCDRRRSKTFIHENYPTYTFEAGFAENDPLWDPNTRETDSAQDARLKTVLDDVFSHDSNTFISITSHSGAISSILRVLGHRPFSLNTGAVIPVLVKAETIEGLARATSIQP